VSRGARTAVVFSCVGHLYIHFCTAFYFVIVLALEQDWGLPYHELIDLWTLGSLLVGVAALPAGLLSDRLGPANMMGIFFIGMGGASIFAGLASGPTALMVALAGIGLFAAIYHPVGIPWLVRNTEANQGKALGLNGVFGTLGSALAGIVAGSLIDLAGWRAAFILPGVVCAGTGAVLVVAWLTGRLPTVTPQPKRAASESGTDARRVLGILLATMFIAGLIFHSTQTSLPKLIEQQNDGLVGEGAFGVGLLVALVYGAAGVMQILGGHLADRLPLKWVYAGAIVLQAPMLWLASWLGGVSLVLVAIVMVMANAGALPAENMLLARYTPEKRHGLVFGLKFVLSFGAAPIAVKLVAFVSRQTGEVHGIYALLALAAFAAFLFAMGLPSREPETVLPAVGEAPGALGTTRPL
jgi:MFS family permease